MNISSLQNLTIKLCISLHLLLFAAILPIHNCCRVFSQYSGSHKYFLEFFYEYTSHYTTYNTISLKKNLMNILKLNLIS